MAKKQTKEEFIQKAAQLHANKYDYSKVSYINSYTKVTVICPEHGEFEITPNAHSVVKRERGETKPRGCSVCGEMQRRKNVAKASRARTKSQDQFIRDSQAVHKDKYLYEKVVYQGSHTKIVITCPEHGDFEQKPYSHLNGQGCPDCGLEIVRRTAKNKEGISASWTQQLFIEECTRVHEGKYNYLNTIFTTTNRTIKADCPIHGEFEQMACEHLRGRGCEKCGRAQIGLARRLSFKQWKKIADETHRENYEYDKSSYTTSKGTIRIRCSKHGWFEQRAGMHAYVGHGCEQCGNERVSSLRTRTLEQLLKQALAVHGNTYDYSEIKSDQESNNVIYDSVGKIPIICKEHGVFSINPNNHIYLQQGCPECSATKGEVRVRQYLELNQIDYVFQWSDHDCTDKGKLRFDFYLPDHRVAIEFDGQQHFMPVNFTGSMTEKEMIAKFDDVLRRDAIKEDWCKAKEIRLIRVPYTENVEKTLMKELRTQRLKN
jgi:hypothetical protein